MVKKTRNSNPKTRIRIYIILIVIIAVLGGIFDYPQFFNQGVDFINSKLGLKVPHFASIPFHLGLDLQGGTHLVYQADVSAVPSKDRGDAVEGVRDVIERRVNAFGVSEPVVQTTKEGEHFRVIVELAGVTDINEAITMIGETPLLEFKEETNEKPELTEEQKQSLAQFNADAKDKAKTILKNVQADSTLFTAVAKEKSQDVATKDKGGDLGIIKEGYPNDEFLKPIEEVAKDEVYSAVVENSDGFNILKRGETEITTKVKASHILICYEGAQRCEQKISKDEARQKIEDLKKQATASNFAELATANSNDTATAADGGNLGYFEKGQMVEAFDKVVFAIKVGEISDIVESQFGFHLIYKTDETPTKGIQIFRILIKKQTEADILPAEQFKYTGLSGKQLKKAQITFNPNTNEPEVQLEFNDEGKELFAQVTERNVNKVVGIFLDGEAISLPTVNEKITGGSAVITGKFSLEEAKTLSRRLNAGALPVPIELISQQTVGASLGQTFISKSLYAALVAFILIALFMIAYYRLPGLLSVIALIIYTIINIVIFKSIPVTLTLSGIAGFVLSVGMAVDANVLIFERMKEELGLGKPLGSASEEGFKRAWPSIRDSNVTTLISCFFLYWFGTSIIRGFALTLFIGVVISMLSAMLMTRVLMNWVIGWKFVNNSDWLFLRKYPKKIN